MDQHTQHNFEERNQNGTVVGRFCTECDHQGSYKVAVDVGEGKPSYNGQRWPSAEDANRAGRDLMSRWMLMRNFSVEPSDDEPNYRYEADRQVHIEKAS